MKLLEVSNVCKSFGGIRALDACSIDVEKGSITGLIGPNGSGKTTLFNVVTGYEKVDRGRDLVSKALRSPMPRPIKSSGSAWPAPSS